MKKLTMTSGALAALLVLGAPVGAAAQTAPPGEAEATAAEVEGVAAIGETHAYADEDSGEATGNAVRLGDAPPSEEFGGTQSGEGSSEGALLDSGETELGRAEVTPWSAEVSEGDDERTADGEAALARVQGLDGNVYAEVLGSRSNARHSGDASSGESESSGATVMLGGEDGLRLVVLHAFSSSAGEGSGGSYVASINDSEILSSEQADGQCNIDVDPLLHLICVYAEGGAADGLTEFTAGAIDLTTLDGNVIVGVARTGASGSDGPAVAQPIAGPLPPAEAAPATAVQPAPTGQLAQTGLELPHLVAIALALLLLGGVTVGHARVRQAA